VNEGVRERGVRERGELGGREGRGGESMHWLACLWVSEQVSE
jgi:hypothetical protein